MSVERGGRAAKLGNRYEGLWVARNLLLLLAGELTSVRVEAIGDDEAGVDLWVTPRNGTREAQQCKRKNRRAGSWTTRELTNRGVLGRLACQLRRDDSYRFSFVSADAAPDLRALCDL